VKSDGANAVKSNIMKIKIYVVTVIVIPEGNPRVEWDGSGGEAILLR
jgi:hypothetical protein